jgi:hypothetical protein
VTSQRFIGLLADDWVGDWLVPQGMPTDAASGVMDRVI